MLRGKGGFQFFLSIYFRQERNQLNDVKECMHLFDGYINSKSTLRNFVEQYEMAVQYRYDQECAAEFKSSYKNSKPISGFTWEKHLEKVLTKKIYDSH